MLGHIMEWFYEGLAGIGQQEGSIAYKSIEIRPQVVGDLTSANANYESPYGRIISEWAIQDKTFHLNVTIPANTTATIYLPAKNSAHVKQDGVLINKLVREKDLAIIKIGSGNYHFEVN